MLRLPIGPVCLQFNHKELQAARQQPSRLKADKLFTTRVIKFMSLPENELRSDKRPNVLRRSYDRVKHKYAGKIRNKAIERAKTRIYLHGRKPEDYSVEILETIVKEEEDKIISEYKSRGIVALVAALGLSFFP